MCVHAGVFGYYQVFLGTWFLQLLLQQPVLTNLLPALRGLVVSLLETSTPPTWPALPSLVRYVQLCWLCEQVTCRHAGYVPLPLPGWLAAAGARE